jgi:hypothetical protein
MVRACGCIVDSVYTYFGTGVGFNFLLARCFSASRAIYKSINTSFTKHAHYVRLLAVSSDFTFLFSLSVIINITNLNPQQHNTQECNNKSLGFALDIEIL